MRVRLRDVRWLIKRSIGRPLFRSKYDYRQQWTSFSTRLRSLVTMEELAPALLSVVTDAVGTASAALYVADEHAEVYHLTASREFDRLPASLGKDSFLFSRPTGHLTPFPIEATPPNPCHSTPLPSRGAVAVPLYWRNTLVGCMVLGPPRTGVGYGPEDFDFLATVAEPAAGIIVTVLMTERSARAREFEAFHRLTSFVIHDFKNAVAGLSMLSANAIEHFNDPDFQRDALKTLARTVDRMKGLLARLAPAPEVSRMHFEAVDLSTLLLETASTVLNGESVTVEERVRPTPLILADRVALGRALQNFLLNALEAVDHAGRITISTEPRHGLVSCEVADDGCGMSAEFIRRSLFVPFRSTKKGGWGIGLYHARELVAAHGGRIEVDSHEGRGTTFRLLFQPLPSPAALPHAAPGNRITTSHP